MFFVVYFALFIISFSQVIKTRKILHIFWRKLPLNFTFLAVVWGSIVWRCGDCVIKNCDLWRKLPPCCWGVLLPPAASSYWGREYCKKAKFQRYKITDLKTCFSVC